MEVADEELAEEGSGYGVGGAGVEGSWEEAGLSVRAHILWPRLSHMVSELNLAFESADQNV